MVNTNMINTPSFTHATTYSDYIDICNECEWFGDGCNGNFDQREQCEFDHSSTIEHMIEENAASRKRYELLLAKQRAEQQEKESTKFYTENPDFLEI